MFGGRAGAVRVGHVEAHHGGVLAVRVPLGGEAPLVVAPVGRRGRQEVQGVREGGERGY